MAQDFGKLVSRLTGEEKKELLAELLTVMKDDDVMEVLSELLSTSTKEELAAQWQGD